MAVLEIRFLSGHYHATAWGRNVNEANLNGRLLLTVWPVLCWTYGIAVIPNLRKTA